MTSSTNSKKLVTFDVASPYAFFRKNYTTTNALTFSVIPRSAVEGLVGSILGVDRERFPDLLKDSKIAVELRLPVRKFNMKYMHVNHDWWNQTLNHYLNNQQFVLVQPRKPMSVPASSEYLFNPSYRIYINTDNKEINNNLASALRNKQSFFTPYLGGSSMFCSIKYVGEYDYEPVTLNYGEYLPVISLIPFFDKIPSVKLEKDVSFATEEDIAIHIDRKRRSIGTYNVLYNVKSGGLLVNDKGIIKLENGTYIKFLPTTRVT